MSWLLLAVGIALEVAGTLCMKMSQGFSDWRPTCLMYLFYALSLTTLTLAFKHIDVSVAYAVWSGAGIVLIASFGVVFFREPMTVTRGVYIGFILIGLVGLYLATPATAE